MHILLRFLGTVLAVLVAGYVAQYLHLGFTIDTIYTAAIVALLLGAISVTIKPIILILTLPINLLTLGLFSFLINAGILLFLASFVQGFTIDGFIPALVGGAVIALVQWVEHIFI